MGPIPFSSVIKEIFSVKAPLQQDLSSLLEFRASLENQHSRFGEKVSTAPCQCEAHTQSNMIVSSHSSPSQSPFSSMSGSVVVLVELLDLDPDF